MSLPGRRRGNADRATWESFFSLLLVDRQPAYQGTDPVLPGLTHVQATDLC
jgi:hypothetical protein